VIDFVAQILASKSSAPMSPMSQTSWTHGGSGRAASDWNQGFKEESNVANGLGLQIL
jgi:hypothetical protein